MADSKRISDFLIAEGISTNDLIETSMFINADEYETRKNSFGALALAFLSDFVFDNLLETDAKSIIGAINELKQSMQYQAGDEVSLYRCIWSGFVTSSMKSLRFMIPLSKGVDEITSVNNKLINTVISGNFEVRTVAGKYIVSGDTLQSLGTVSIYKNESGLMVEVVGETEFQNAVNNTPVALYAGATAKITFN